MKRTLIFFALVFACSDVEVPPDVLLSCDEDSECPSGQICEPTTKLCVREALDELNLLVAPTVSPALVGQPDVDDGELAVTFSFTASPFDAPRVSLEDEAQTVLFEQEVNSDSDTAYALTFLFSELDAAIEGGLPEGRLLVFTDVVDARGVPLRFLLGEFVVDRTPPSIINANLVRRPDPRATPVAFEINDAATTGPASAVRVSFTTDEPVVNDPDDERAPSVRLLGSALALVRDAAIPNPFFFDLQWPVDPVGIDGTFSLTARVTDLAGNVSETDIGLELIIDASLPSQADVETEGAVTLQRAPWGLAADSTLDVYTVVGEAGSVEGDAFVLVSRDPEGLLEIGRTRADGTGAFGGAEFLRLATGDVREVFVRVVDGAGNFAAPVRVRDGEWTASLGGKRAGNLVDNPHRFEVLPIFTSRLSQGSVFERDGSELELLDGQTVDVEGAGSWEQLASDESDALGGGTFGEVAFVNASFGHDPVTGTSLFYGGGQLENVQLSSIIQDGQCTIGRDVLFVRRADGRLRRVDFDPAEQRPVAMTGARFAFDTSRARLILLGMSVPGNALGDFAGSAEMWAIDTSEDTPRFEALCTDVACRESMPALLSRHGLVFDPINKELILQTRGFDAATYVFRDDVWVKVCDVDTPACNPRSNERESEGTLTFDTRAGRALWFDGVELASWDGSAWEALCTDAACIASKPPERTQPAMTFDPLRERLVLFGGQSSNPCSIDNQEPSIPAEFPPDQPFGDTWEFDGSVWTQSVTSESPNPRALHSMGFDATRGRVVLAGGDDCGCVRNPRWPGFNSNYDEDVWEYDGSEWTRVDRAPEAPPGFVAEAAFGARDHKAAPSAELGGVVFYGDAQNGTQLGLIRQGRFYRSEVDTQAVGPFYPGLSAAPDGTIFVVGGGFVGGAGGGPSNSPHALVVDGNTLSPFCAPDPTCGQGVIVPPAAHGVAHDGERIVVFGGFDQPGGYNPSNFETFSSMAGNRTWTFSEANGFIENVSSGPPPRVRAQLSPTGVLGEVLAFGGGTSDDSTWIFSGDTWTETTPSFAPPARQDHLLEFDEGRDAVLMTFGVHREFVDDFRNTEDTSIPAAFDTVFEWANNDWHVANEADPERDGRPVRRYGFAAAHDPLTGGVVLHGGTPSPEALPDGGQANASTTRLDDVWRWNGGERSRPAARFSVTTTAANLDDESEITSVELTWHGAGELFIWDAGWRALSSTSCGAGCLRATMSATDARRAIHGQARELTFSLVGAPNPAAPAYTTVATDYVELRVNYRR